MMKHIVFFTVIIAISMTGCVGEKPLSEIEATDEEAIYNVIRIDNYRLSTLDLIASDTVEFIIDQDTASTFCWHVIEESNEDLSVSISDYKVDSPVGPVYSASVDYSRTFSGTFETLRYNAETDSMERFSKEFVLSGSRSAVCQQWGISNQVRRGWLLISISDARFSTPAGSYHFLDSLYYSLSTDSIGTFSYGIHNPDDLIHFELDEEVTIHHRLIDDVDLLLMFVPVNNYAYQLAVPQPDSSGGFEVVFDMPGRRIYGQLRFLVINAKAIFNDYRASGYSYNYSTR
jgi:hypothetical protein